MTEQPTTQAGRDLYAVSGALDEEGTNALTAILAIEREAAAVAYQDGVTAARELQFDTAEATEHSRLAPGRLARALFGQIGWPTRYPHFNLPDGLRTGDSDNPEWRDLAIRVLAALDAEGEKP